MKIIDTNVNFKYPAKSNSPFDEVLKKTLKFLSSYSYEIDKLVFLVDSGNHAVSIFPGSPGEDDQIEVDTMLTATLTGYEEAFDLSDRDMLRFIEKVEAWFTSRLKRAWKSFKLKDRFADEFINQECGVYLDLGGDFDSFDIRACELIWGTDTRKSPDSKEELVNSFCAKYDAEPTFLLGHDRPISKVVVISCHKMSSKFTPDLLSLADQLNIKDIPLWICPRHQSDFESADLLELKRCFDVSLVSEELEDEYLAKTCQENRRRGKAGEERFVL